MPAFRSVVSVLVSLVVGNSYERKAALRAAVQPGLPARKPSQRLGLGDRSTWPARELTTDRISPDLRRA
jgi:hypothetical protein